jgi:hypothetical protein
MRKEKKKRSEENVEITYDLEKRCERNERYPALRVAEGFLKTREAQRARACAAARAATRAARRWV